MPFMRGIHRSRSRRDNGREGNYSCLLPLFHRDRGLYERKSTTTVELPVDSTFTKVQLLGNIFHATTALHDDVIKWKHFPRYWPFVRGIHRSTVNSPHKGQWRGALMFTLICARINGWVNNREAGDLRRYRAHYDVIVMCTFLHGAP